MQISEAMGSLIRDKFPSSEATAILDAISSLDEQDLDGQDPDRIVGAILILKKRRTASLEAIVRLAETDWRDLLMGAGLADDDWSFHLGDAIASWNAESV